MGARVQSLADLPVYKCIFCMAKCLCNHSLNDWNKRMCLGLCVGSDHASCDFRWANHFTIRLSYANRMCVCVCVCVFFFSCIYMYIFYLWFIASGELSIKYVDRFARNGFCVSLILWRAKHVSFILVVVLQKEKRQIWKQYGQQNNKSNQIESQFKQTQWIWV